MPILKNAKKALRVSERKTVVNRRVKSRVKTALDAVKKTPTAEALQESFSAIDKAANKHLMHKNKAARVKSQLSKLLPTGASKPAAKKSK
jgi:small subunit ribosomal protein S20